MSRVLLPCGCPIVVDHEKGDRRVTCQGSGLTPSDGNVLGWEICPGGRGYAVTARERTVIDYTIRPFGGAS